VYKQERDTNRRPPPLFSLSKPATSLTPQTALHQVDSIIEDEEENHSHHPRARQGSIASQPTSSFAAIIPGRIRSVSTSSAGIRNINKQSTRSPSVQAAPSSFSRNIEMVQNRDVRKASDNGLPARTHNRQRRRDSLDLDDVMNGSDDDGDQGSVLRNQNLPPPATPRTGRAQYAVSAHTRDLMAFLAQGPPEPKVSQSGSELLDVLAQGPPGGAMMLDPIKPKGAGRLQRMISKLSIGGEKAKAGSDATRTPSLKQPSTPVRSTISNKPSISTLSSLANRPIPPRPRPISPPPSPYSYDEDNSIREDKSIRSPPHNPRQDTSSPRESPVMERAMIAKQVTIPPALMPSNKYTTQEEKPTHRLLASHVNGNARNGYSPKGASSEPPHVLPPVGTVSRKAVPAIDSSSTPFFTERDAKDMQRLFTNATTVDECRLIFDMFIARNGIAKRSASDMDAPYPSPSPSVIKHVPHAHSSDGEASIESTLVEFFLSDTATPDIISRVLSEPNQPDAPIEAPPVVVGTKGDVKPVVNTPPPNRPFVRPLRPDAQGC